MMRSPAWATVWSALRAAMAVAIGVAVVAQLLKSVGTAMEQERDVATTIANFFSFFTVLSNTAAAAVLTWAAVWYWRRGRRALSTRHPSAADASSGASGRLGRAEPASLAVALTCVSTYMIVTGIVYNTLLRGIVLPQGSEPIWWSNEVLHLVGPLFLLADVFVGPLRRALPWRALWVIVVFPIVWAVYTMIRGPLTTNPVNEDPFWYPYPFLNPNNPDLQPLTGYAGVVLYVVGIAMAIVAIGAFVVWWGRRAVGAGTDAAAVVAGISS